MQQIITALHHLHTQFAYLPILLFLVALLIVIASFYNPKPQGRYIGYCVAVAMILCFAFIL